MCYADSTVRLTVAFTQTMVQSSWSAPALKRSLGEGNLKGIGLPEQQLLLDLVSQFELKATEVHCAGSKKKMEQKNARGKLIDTEGHNSSPARPLGNQEPRRLAPSPRCHEPSLITAPLTELYCSSPLAQFASSSGLLPATQPLLLICS